MAIKLLNAYLYTVKYVNIDCAFVIFPVFLCIFLISFPLLFGCFYGHLHVNSKKILFLFLFLFLLLILIIKIWGIIQLVAVEMSLMSQTVTVHQAFKKQNEGRMG